VRCTLHGCDCDCNLIAPAIVSSALCPLLPLPLRHPMCTYFSVRSVRCGPSVAVVPSQPSDPYLDHTGSGPVSPSDRSTSWSDIHCLCDRPLGIHLKIPAHLSAGIVPRPESGVALYQGALQRVRIAERKFGFWKSKTSRQSPDQGGSWQVFDVNVGRNVC